MKKNTMYLTFTLLALAIMVLASCGKKENGGCCSPWSLSPTSLAPQPAVLPEKPVAVATNLPRLIDLGSVSCIPCKMMAPILEDLKTTRAQQFTTVFYDVWQDKSKAEEYRISVIPTQIFLDKEGKELFRHEGYFPKAEILKKWRELGYDFDAQTNQKN